MDIYKVVILLNNRVETHRLYFKILLSTYDEQQWIKLGKNAIRASSTASEVKGMPLRDNNEFGSANYLYSASLNLVIVKNTTLEG